MSREAELVGAEIRRIRLARRWSVARLAEAADLSPTYAGAIERGEKAPTVTTLAKISRALEVDPGLLLAPLSLNASKKITKAELLRLAEGHCLDSYSQEQAARILEYLRNPE